MSAPHPEQSFRFAAAGHPGFTAEATEDADAAAARKARQEEDARAAARAAKDKEAAEVVRLRKAHAAAAGMDKPQPQMGGLLRLRPRAGVYQNEDEIDIYAHSRRGLTRQQMEEAVKAAMQKGWNEIFVYDANGNPDLKMAAALNSVIVEMGVSDRIHCCIEPGRMCAHIDEAKMRARQVAAAPVTGLHA